MKNFEKYAKSRLENHTSDLDIDRHWQRLEAQLAQKKRRRLIIFGWTFVGVLAVLVGAFYSLKLQPPTSISGKNDAEISIESPQRLDFDALQTEKLENAAPPIPPFSTHHLKNQPNQILNGATQQSLFLEKNNKNQAKTYENQPLPFASQELPETNLQAETDLTIENLTPVFEQNNTANTHLTAAEVIPSPIILLDLPEKNDLSIRPDPNHKCYSFVPLGKKIHLYFGGFAGATLPLKSLKTNDVEMRNLVLLRSKTEAVLEAWQVGAFVGARHQSGIYAEAGSEFLQINERFRWQTTRRDTTGFYTLTGMIINKPGDTTFINETVYIEQVTRTTRTTYNRYKTLQIPLALGYDFQCRGRWSPYLKLGAAINVFFEQKAEIFTPNSQSQLFTSRNPANPHPFRTQLGIMPFANFGVRYALRPRWELFSELRYIHPMLSFSASDNAIEQNYRLPGLNFGVVFR